MKWSISMNPESRKIDRPSALKELIESGRLGMKTGRGFYTYPNPEFANADFLDPNQ